MSEHPISGLPDRGKEPANRRALLGWLAAAATSAQIAPRRLNTLIANSIVLSALSRAVDDENRPLFLLKGGTLRELRLGLRARASSDLDTLFRGEFDKVIEALDATLREGWGSLTFQRTEPREINVASRRVKPLRLDVKILVRGVVTLTAQLEVAADEGGAGDAPEAVPLPSLSHFGIDSAESAAALAMDFQVAQKMHACTDPTPTRRNDRVHDVVDLLLVREAFFRDADLPQLRQACEAIFDARASDAQATGHLCATGRHSSRRTRIGPRPTQLWQRRWGDAHLRRSHRRRQRLDQQDRCLVSQLAAGRRRAGTVSATRRTRMTCKTISRRIDRM